MTTSHGAGLFVFQDLVGRSSWVIYIDYIPTIKFAYQHSRRELRQPDAPTTEYQSVAQWQST
jgi:hypothetical protein